MENNEHWAARRHRRYRVKAFNGTARTSAVVGNRSHKNMAAQMIDDKTGPPWFRRARSIRISAPDQVRRQQDAAAEAIGKLIAERALATGIKEVAFDRGH